MSVIPKLASTLGTNTEVPNKKLALEIAKKKDYAAISELVDILSDKNKAIQSDCIKVLDEIGAVNPELIAKYDKHLLALLDSKNSRLVWGAMTTLDYIAGINPHGIYKHLAKILDVADKGSVITKDHCVGILSKLASEKKYSDESLALLIDILKDCAVNQLPMYAEKTLPVMTEKHAHNFSKVLSSRVKDVESEAKRRRIERVLKKVSCSFRGEIASSVLRVVALSSYSQ